MYYSENVRKKKIAELENNKTFMDYARDSYEECKQWGVSEDRTFEEYLLREVFTLCDNFELLQFLKKSDKKTIDKVMSEALKGLDF